MMIDLKLGELVELEPYGVGRVVEIVSTLFVRVQWPMFDTPQLITTLTNAELNPRKGSRGAKTR